MPEIFTLPFVSDANLIAYYRFNTGALTTDSKGSNTLNSFGSPAELASGKFGVSVDLGTNNTANWFNIPANDLGIAGNSNISMSLWVKIRTEPGLNTTKTIIQQASTTTTDRYLRINYKDVSGVKKLEVDFSGTLTTTDITLGTSSWHHLCIVRSVGVSGSLYLDGQVIITGAVLGATNYGLKRFNIGADEDGVNGFISAYLDDIAIFNRSINAAEVATIYGATAGFLAFM